MSRISAPDHTPNRLGIVGATGWLGQGLGLNLLQKGLWRASELVILNRSGQMGGYADHPGVILARDMDEMQALCGTIILSVRPEDFPLPGFAPGNCLLISFMAAVPMARLAALAPEARIVRAMPNGGATSGTSYTPWLAGALDAGDVALTRRILSAMGDEDRVESDTRDAELLERGADGADQHGARALGDDEARGDAADVAVKVREQGDLAQHDELQSNR